MSEVSEDYHKERTLVETSENQAVESDEEQLQLSETGGDTSESSGESEWMEVTDDGEEESEEEESETEEPRQYAVLDRNGDVMIEPITSRGRLKIPSYGMKYVRLANGEANPELLRQGERDVIKYQAGIQGHLNEELYELVRTKTLSVATLNEVFPKSSRSTNEHRLLYLNDRYRVSDAGIIHDNRRGNRVVCEPVHIYDIIMSTHLMNNHATKQKVFESMTDFYSNITRRAAEFAVQHCSVCTPEMVIDPPTPKIIVDHYKNLFSYERIQVEIMEPFPGKKIEGKYTHIFFAKDYHSRFTWAIPLKNVRFKRLVQVLAKFLLELPRQAMFLETVTLEWQDMFDICEQVTKDYHFSIGLGTQKNLHFLSSGIAAFRKRLGLREAECITDWNMCIKYGVTIPNRATRYELKGSSSTLLVSELPGTPLKYAQKHLDLLKEMSAKHILQVGKNTLYLEVVKDEDDIFVDDDNVQYSEEEGYKSPTDMDGNRDIRQGNQAQVESDDNMDDLINMMPIGYGMENTADDFVGETPEQRAEEESEETNTMEQPPTLFYTHPSERKRNSTVDEADTPKRAKTDQFTTGSMSLEI